MTDRLITVAEFAQRFGVGKSTVYGTDRRPALKLAGDFPHRFLASPPSAGAHIVYQRLGRSRASAWLVVSGWGAGVPWAEVAPATGLIGNRGI